MKFLLVDGYNLAFRAFHGMPEFTRKDGFPVGAIHGWVRMLWKLQDFENDAKTVVFFDKDGSKRHLEIHPEYKGTRAETPPALKLQFPEIKRITSLLGIRVFERSGIEADDLIASAAVSLSNAGNEVFIASSDKDFAQCVNDQVSILAPVSLAEDKGGWKKLDRAGVIAKYGVPPEQIVDYLSLIGDTIDNIPGIKGVGPKTAVTWLQKYQNIAGILAEKHTILPERFRPQLAESVSLLEKNQKLIAFKNDFSENWDAPLSPENDTARDFFREMALHSTLREFERRAGNDTAIPQNIHENFSEKKIDNAKNDTATQLELF